VPDMVHLFIHLLLMANHKDGAWQGIKVLRGQVITGRKTLSENTGLSEQSIRTCIKRLKSTNEITSKSTSKFSIITICNYDKYNTEKSATNQHNNQPANQQSTSNQPAINQQLTTNKNDKNDKNDNNGKNVEAKATQFQKDIFTDDFIEKYGKPMLQAFYNYWSEPNRSNTKMRMELQQTWKLAGRLATWQNRETKGKPKVNDRVYHEPPNNDRIYRGE